MPKLALVAMGERAKYSLRDSGQTKLVGAMRHCAEGNEKIRILHPSGSFVI